MSSLLGMNRRVLYLPRESFITYTVTSKQYIAFYDYKEKKHRSSNLFIKGGNLNWEAMTPPGPGDKDRTQYSRWEVAGHLPSTCYEPSEFSCSHMLLLRPTKSLLLPSLLQKNIEVQAEAKAKELKAMGLPSWVPILVMMINFPWWLPYSLELAKGSKDCTTRSLSKGPCKKEPEWPLSDPEAEWDS